jgi:hypothetical protein
MNAGPGISLSAQHLVAPPAGLDLLLIRRDFPGPFRDLVPLWSALPGWRVSGISGDATAGYAGVPWRPYRLHRRPGMPSSSELRLRGEAVARTLQNLGRRGFRPDVVLADADSGESLHVKDVFPDARLVLHCAREAGTMDADPAARAHCDAAVSPSWWQRSLYPEQLRQQITVIHEGVHRAARRADCPAHFITADGRTLRAGDPVVTLALHASARVDAVRCMRALERVQRQYPDCQLLLIAGFDRYGDAGHAAAAQWLHAGNGLDVQRIHLVADTPPGVRAAALRVSAVHVDLSGRTCPATQLLEAMACGCAVVAADAAPVREVARHGVSACLVDPGDERALAEALIALLERPSLRAALGREAEMEALRSFDIGTAAQRYARLLCGEPAAPVPPECAPDLVSNECIALHDYAFSALRQGRHAAAATTQFSSTSTA